MLLLLFSYLVLSFSHNFQSLCTCLIIFSSELLRQRFLKYVKMIILVFPNQDTLHSDDDHWSVPHIGRGFGNAAQNWTIRTDASSAWSDTMGPRGEFRRLASIPSCLDWCFIGLGSKGSLFGGSVRAAAQFCHEKQHSFRWPLYSCSCKHLFVIVSWKLWNCITVLLQLSSLNSIILDWIILDI